MRRLVLLVTSAALVLAACGETLSQLDGTGWAFFAYDSGDGVVDKLSGTEPTITFEGDTVSGSDGCNDFTGTYEISSGNMITIGPLASTLKACEPDVMLQADAIMSIVSDAILYEKTGDDQLIMRTQTADFVGYDRLDVES